MILIFPFISVTLPPIEILEHDPFSDPGRDANGGDVFPLTGGLRTSPGEWENPHNVLWEGKIRNKKSKPRIWLMKFIEKDIIFLTKKAIIYSVKWEASQQILITVHPSRLVEFACTLICIYISSSINSLYSRNKCI